jgi:hypothetical protein
VFVLKKVLGNAGTLIALLVMALIGVVLTGKFSLGKSLQIAGHGVKNGAVNAAHKIEDFQQRRRERNSFYNQDEEEAKPNYHEMIEENPRDIVQPILKFSPDDVEGKEEVPVKEKTVEAPKPYKPVLPPHKKEGDTSYVFPSFNLLHPVMKINKKDLRKRFKTKVPLLNKPWWTLE